MKMRKGIFIFIIILTCLVTCTPFSPEGHEEIEYTDVVYSPEKNSVTIYLDGQVPASRTLNRELAMMFCDYFEVTFLYQTTTDTIVTRGDWMIGRQAGVSGVFRTDAGIDYGHRSKAPGNEEGSAILFAGKSDKTLMAVGYLVNAVDAFGVSTGTRINTNTKSVTFVLDAITAAVNDLDDTDAAAKGTLSSSFVTNVKDTDLLPSFSNTEVVMDNVFATEDSKFFPLFRLDPGIPEIKAEYTFRLHSAGDFSAYSNGIFVASRPMTAPGLPVVPVPPGTTLPPGVIERKQPRYTTKKGKFHESILILDEKTAIAMVNNNLPDDPFENVVKLTFNTKNTVNGSVFSLVFSIPVYALDDKADENGNVSKSWYIRSSYGTNLYDLDDGTDGMGGAVLLSTGYAAPPSGDYRIIIVNPPNKWQYSGSKPNPDGTGPQGRVFDITGLEVILATTGDPYFKIGPSINYSALEFYIGKYPYEEHPTWEQGPPPAWADTVPTGNPYVFPVEFYGCIEITVVYYYGASRQRLTAVFYVLVSNFGMTPNFNFSNINPNLDIVHIPLQVNPVYPHPRFPGVTGNPLGIDGSRYDFTAILQAAAKNLPLIIVLHESFNIENVVMNDDDANTNIQGDGSRLILILAGEPNLMIGRRAKGGATAPYNGTDIYHFIRNAGLNGFYFGTWSFNGNNEITFPALATPVKTYPYVINAGGPVNYDTNYNAYPPHPLVDATLGPTNVYRNKMIVGWGTGGMYNVKKGPGVYVHPDSGYDLLDPELRPPNADYLLH
jgi:hypothetical protein